MAFRLQTLLDLKLRAEEEAERAMAAAMMERGKVEAKQNDLEAAVNRAREQVAEAREGRERTSSGGRAKGWLASDSGNVWSRR